ncbi:MAG TPA: PQQ-binding-like beta-propeller repeat protein [Thermoanaerobaculia bacterium]|nr:PQQ-binding-like beta-propeller repeat protein [Thermoanaerobaculia bacterium]
MIPQEITWKFRLDNERRVGARRPAVSGGLVYVAFFYDKRDFSESKLFAFDVESGAQKWAYTIDHVANEPVVADGVVYWSSFEGSIHALDGDGRLLWKAPGTDSNIGAPVLGGDDRLFVAEIAGGASNTWCLDRKTGATLWRFEHGGHTYRLHHSAGRLFHTAVAHTSMDEPTRCSLYCLSAANGSVLWSVSDREYLFNPIVLGDKVFVCSHHSARMYSIDSGKLLAEAPLEREKTTLHLASCSEQHRLIVWGDNYGQDADSVSAVEVSAARRLFGGEKPSLSRTWKVEEARGLCEAPIALSRERIMYLTHDGVLCVIASATGERLSETRLKTKPATFGGLSLVGDQLFVAHGREVFSFMLDGAETRS